MDAVPIVKQQFYSSFSVPSKSIIKSDLLHVDSYSQLNPYANNKCKSLKRLKLNIELLEINIMI